MYLRKILRPVSLLLLTIVFTTFVVSSCGIAEAITGITPTPVTPSPTPRECPSNTILNMGDELKSTPTLFVILFDQNAAFSGPGLEFENAEITFDTELFVNRMMPKILGPGDQYSLFLSGYSEYGISRVSGFESRIESSPSILSTPLPYLTATPYNTPDVASDLPLERMQELNKFTNNVATQQVEVDQLQFEQNCIEKNYNESINATGTVWAVTKSAEVAEIATQIKDDNAKKGQIGQPTPTPFQEVYYGLEHVSNDFDFLCEKYERCILIIFDDLKDWRNPGELSTIPDNFAISLEKVDLISVITDCNAVQDPRCQEAKKRWDEKFKIFGAKSTIYFDGVRLEEKLVRYISELEDPNR